MFIFFSEQGESPNGCAQINTIRLSNKSINSSIHNSSNIHNSVSIANNSSSPSMLRRTNTEKALLKKKRVIKMLCAVVLEFFICWTPLYVINTVSKYHFY